MTLDIEQVLVPVDATDQAEQAVRYGLAIADRYDAAVHVLHVIDEPVKRGIETGEVDPEAVADEQVSFADDAAEFADGVSVTHSTVVGFSRSRLRQHPGSAILDVAEELPADFVVVPREHGTEPDETLGKSAQYVVEYASQPVLSV
ncbi:universal stress protein [Halosimplex halophilum]|uniref:universal stress protein n=1 Tax=Halosimplex halophilum TaxID=2559572 RepID=UPI00107F92AB|nr:universal stress protein [Halosimplex halophilum]